VPDEPVKNRDLTKTVVINADGSITQLGTVDERALTYEDGSHEYSKTEIRVTTIDGHVLKTNEIAFQCTNCRTGPWSAHASTTCSTCQRRVCLPCSKQTDDGAFCKPCHETAHRRACWSFLRSIT
jgi:hypothetical protein